MGYQVSVRDVGFSTDFAKNLEVGVLELPKECQHNADMLKELLGRLGHVAPGLADVSSEGLGLVAGAVAYALRPDHLGKTRKPRGVDRALFKRDPRLLPEKFILPPHYYDQGEVAKQEQETAMEFFRCLSVPYAYVPEFKEKVEYGDTVNLADAMAHVVDTTFFTLYKYDPETIQWYRETLERDLDDM